MAITAQLVKELRDKTGAGMMDCKKALTATDGNIDGAIDWLRENGISKAAKKADRIAAEGLCSVEITGNTAFVFELNSETDFVAQNQKFLDLLDFVGKEVAAADTEEIEKALAHTTSKGTTLEAVLTDATATIGEKITLRRINKVVKTDDQVFGAYKHAGGRIAVLTLLEGADEETAKQVAMHVAAIAPKYLESSQISEEEIEKEKHMLTTEALNEGKPADIVEKMIVGRLNKYFKEICLVDQPIVVNPDLTVQKYVAEKGGKVLDFKRLEVGEGIEKAEVDFAAEVNAQING